MAELSAADQYMLEQIRSGEATAWTQLVERYEGRLCAFARSRMRQKSEAEDIVQETFISFLKGVEHFRGDASIETYLFTILRRRIIDSLRGQKLNVCSLQDSLVGSDDGRAERLHSLADSGQPTASWHARLDEEQRLRADALTAALRSLIESYKEKLNFRDLQILEALFYCQLRNKDIAELLDVREQQIGLIKHRTLQRIRDHVEATLTDAGLPRYQVDASTWRSGDEDASHAMLRSVWEDHRLSCPKRSTIGAYHLGSLDETWTSYVDFHLHTLGCRYCLANLDDLKKETSDTGEDAFRSRILKSTIGFLHKVG